MFVERVWVGVCGVVARAVAAAAAVAAGSACEKAEPAGGALPSRALKYLPRQLDVGLGVGHLGLGKGRRHGGGSAKCAREGGLTVPIRQRAAFEATLIDSGVPFVPVNARAMRP